MKLWNIKRTVYTVSDLVSWYKQGSLELNPHFQRRPVWRPGAKSFLIDTILKGLPIPIIIIREKRANLNTLEPVREVVDGQQRIRTIISYINNKLLSNYSAVTDEFQLLKNHNADIAGKKFPELSSELRQRILDYEFSVHVLPANVGDTEIYEIFSRMNATGYKLNHQELRNARYYGLFKTAVYTCAGEQLDRFRKWEVLNDTEISRMEEAQLISEFLGILVKRDLSSRSQLSITRNYRQLDKKFAGKESYIKMLRTVFDAIEDTLAAEMPTLIFRKKTLFYTLFAVFYDEIYGIKRPSKKPAKLSARFKAKLLQVNAIIQSGKAPKKVMDAFGRRTTHISSRRTLFEYVSSMV